MINVGMAEDDGFQFIGLEWEVPVSLDGFSPLALEQPTLQQQPTTTKLEQEH